MKSIYIIVLLLFQTCCLFSQSETEENSDQANDNSQSSFTARKEKGFYNVMQVSFLLGNNQIVSNMVYYTPNYAGDPQAIDQNTGYVNPNTRTKLGLVPSFTISNGYMFNDHWAAGAGIGFEIYDHNLFPLFAELRYTIWDHKMSPFVGVKGGYAFGGFKSRHYDELYLDWAPHYVTDVQLRHYGGLMFHPEVGVKIPLNTNSDLLLAAAYRYQKTKSVARKDFGGGQFEEWEHKEEINLLSFGAAIMFR